MKALKNLQENYYIQTLAVHCEYKEQTNEMVRAHFVMGVRDQAVKQKLELITDLSLDKAMTFARQHEQVKLQMREQQLEQDQHVAETRVSPNPRTAIDEDEGQTHCQ